MQRLRTGYPLYARRMRSSNFTAMEVRERREKSRGHGHKRPTRECSAHDLRERLWPCNTPHMSEDDSTRVYRTVSCVQNSARLCAGSSVRDGVASLCIPPLTSDDSDRSKCAQWRVVTHSYRALSILSTSSLLPLPRSLLLWRAGALRARRQID